MGMTTEQYLFLVCLQAGILISNVILIALVARLVIERKERHDAPANAM
jgi:hypothetical protein